jgi:uncharacterized membrane protein
MFNNCFFKNCAVYEIMWKNMVQTDNQQCYMTRAPFWITMATNTSSEYVILIAFSRHTVVTRTRRNVTLYSLGGIIPVV